ncbi:unnamed protein product [Caenorhabditis angaria]|uniref:G-protein coupled receptors family 1 profile domain-containing protein n=1 Tax=Caenorhabditis angaria TaxID=860376 RepID=A0A9P1MWR9_9PELO|nr:unnamed protein product [Caenorhabditis angaria]
MLSPEKHFWFFLTFYGILSVLFDYLIPIMIMVIANYCVIRELRRNDVTITTLNVQKRKEQNTTVMLLVVTIIFTICHSVGGVFKMIEIICGRFMLNGFYLYFADLTVFLIVLHTSSTFFLYYAFSGKFRTIFWTVIKCRNKYSEDFTKLSLFYPSAQTSMIIETKRKLTKKENFV